MTDDEKIKKYLQDALDKHQRGEHEQAIEDYTQAIELDPNHADAYKNRGMCYEKLGQYEQAIDDFNQAIQLDPRNANAFNYRGVVYAQLDEHELAIEDFNHIIGLTPKDAIGFHTRGLANTMRDHNKEAIKDFTQALKLNSKLVSALYNRCIAYTLTGESAQAIKDFLELIKYTKEPTHEGGDLYKYVPINSYQILSIINQELYFTPYHQLNDPLECFFINHENSASAFGALLKQEDRQAHILALTHQPEFKLMYSHYANGHQGLCIEYQLNFDSLKTNDAIAYGAVSYGEKTDIENLNDLYLLKNIDWKYEQEYRLVRFDNKEFLPCQIKSITFGFRCPEEHRKIIYNISQRLNIEYWELKQAGQTNNLERVLIDDHQKYEVGEEELFKLMLKHRFENLYHYFKHRNPSNKGH